MAKTPRKTPRSRPTEEFAPRKTSWVVRAGIAILGLAVAISSLIPILSFFQR